MRYVYLTFTSAWSIGAEGPLGSLDRKLFFPVRVILKSSKILGVVAASRALSELSKGGRNVEKKFLNIVSTAEEQKQSLFGEIRNCTN